jgi:hypothetical protein
MLQPDEIASHHILSEMFVNNTEYINNCELIPGEAHYSMVLLLLQYGLGLVNLCELGLVNPCGLGLVNLCNLEF